MIKLLALITMLIDHIGYSLFPNITILRIVGRISMPLYSFSIARGYFYSKKNNKLNKYLKNLLIFATISQIPYSLLTSSYTLNIIFTYLFSILILILLDSNTEKIIKIASLITIISILLSLDTIYFCDYGLFGIFLPIIIYYFVYNKKYNFSVFLLLCILLLLEIVFFQFSKYTEFIALIDIPIVYMLNKYDNKIKLPKYFYYLFYPVHMLILFVIKLFI